MREISSLLERHRTDRGGRRHPGLWKGCSQLGLRRNWRGAELVGGARLGVDHVHHRVDERQVRESLREVAQVAAAARVDLLRVELERARVRQQLFAQLACAVQLVDLAQRGHQPERADGERALLSMQPVHQDRKSTRLNSSHSQISYAVFCLKKKTQ